MIKTLQASLEWESFEQTAFWTLLSSHRGIKIENWIQVFPYIDSESHPEALSAIWTMLGNAEPTNNIVKMLFARDQDEIVVSTLSNWLRKRKDMTKLADAMVFVMTTVSPKSDLVRGFEKFTCPKFKTLIVIVMPTIVVKSRASHKDLKLPIGVRQSGVTSHET